LEHIWGVVPQSIPGLTLPLGMLKLITFFFHGGLGSTLASGKRKGWKGGLEEGGGEEGWRDGREEMGWDGIGWDGMDQMRLIRHRIDQMD